MEKVLRRMQHCIRTTTRIYARKWYTARSAEAERRLSAMATKGQGSEETARELQRKDGQEPSTETGKRPISEKITMMGGQQ